VPTTMAIVVTSVPGTGTVLTGTTRQFAIEVRDQSNIVLPAFTAATWSIVGTNGIATLTQAGLATCTTAGTVTVHAVGPLGPSGANLTADASLQCVEPIGNVATGIILTPWTLTTPVGSTVMTTATFIDAGGLPTTNGCTVGFSVDAAGPTTIATESHSGLTATVTGVVAGRTALRASCTTGSPLTALARVEVTTAPLNVARLEMETRFHYFPESPTATSFHFAATALNGSGTTVPAAVIEFTIAGGSAASTGTTGTVEVAPTAGGAGGPGLSGGAVLTAASGSQTEVAFLTYGNAGTISGHVTSTTGQYVGGTTASATNMLTGSVTPAGGITNDGYFYIVGLSAGSYSVTVTGAISGQVQTFPNVAVTAGQETIVTMTPLALRERE